MSLPLILGLLLVVCYLAWLLMNRMLAIRAHLHELNEAMRQSDKRMATLLTASDEGEQRQDE